MLPREKLEGLKQELAELQNTLSDSSALADPRRYRELMRRNKELSAICGEWDRYLHLEAQVHGVEHLLRTETDPEMADMARQELEELVIRIEGSEIKLRDLLIPSDPNDSKNAIVEIRAGTGGEEAALFVADLYRMYSYYAEQKGWKQQLLDLNETGLGGYKEIIFMLSGTEAATTSLSFCAKQRKMAETRPLRRGLNATLRRRSGLKKWLWIGRVRRGTT